MPPYSPPGGPKMQSRNLAARAGRFSARHRKAAIFGWIAFVVVAIFLGGAVGTKTIGDGDGGNGESGRADHAIHHKFPEKADEQVLIQSRSAKASDPAFQATIRSVVKRL